MSPMYRILGTGLYLLMVSICAPTAVANDGKTQPQSQSAPPGAQNVKAESDPSPKAESIKDNPTVVFLAAVVGAFIAGFGAFEVMLRVSDQERVRKDSYVLKKDLVGNLIKSVAIREVENLIEVGTNLNATTDPSKAETYLLRVTTFLHTLDLPKDVDFIGDKMSLAEQDVRMIIQRNPSRGHSNLTDQQRVDRVVGILQGLKSGFMPLM